MSISGLIIAHTDATPYNNLLSALCLSLCALRDFRLSMKGVHDVKPTY